MRLTTRTRTLVLILAIMLLAGCYPKKMEVATGKTTVKIQPSPIWEVTVHKFPITIYKFTDLEEGVTCYIIDGSNRSGISCLPLENADAD